jgi:hypothetical protein
VQFEPCANGLFGRPWNLFAFQPTSKRPRIHAEELRAFGLGKAEAHKALFQFGA